jgi:hypothetical protein
VSFLDDWENLAIFTAGEFSDLAVVTSNAMPSVFEISGIFDERHELMFTNSLAEGRQITFLVETSKATGLGKGDRLTIKGKDYQITELKLETDGNLIRIFLKR